MRTVTRLTAAAGAVSTLALLCACAAGSAADGPTGPGADATPVAGGTVVYGHQQEAECVFGGWIEQAYLSYNILDSLVALDDDGEVVPWLATAWTASDDLLTYTLTLRDDVTFTDGSRLTAGVVAYNFDRWLAGGNSTARAWLAGYYASAEAADDTTLLLHLSRPYPRLLENLSQGYFGIQSQQALETRTDEENCEQPIGSGAFAVEKWNRGQNIVLVRNDDYQWAPANAGHQGPAYVERVDWRYVPDATTRVAALRGGETDLIYDVPAVDWKNLGNEGFEQLRYVTGGRPQQLSFTTTTGPFTDEKVRKAFAYSLDRKKIVETIGQGLIPYEGNGAVSQATPGYSQKAADTYSYDPATADELLDAAGWTERDDDGTRLKDGQRLHITLPYAAGATITADGASILQGVQQQAKAVGFDVELVPFPRSAGLAGAYTKPEERDLQVGYWTAVNAGILYITWRPATPEWPNGSNSAFYDDPELERIILEANSEPDVDAQNALYEQAQEYIADRALSIGLFDRISTLAISPRLQGVRQEHAQGGPVFHDAHFVD